ncbi:MAG: O-antigen ligase family protein, partial [Deltaproteobacteria bacterium]|nr:O-antigen ligase family protein [Deltaproteobacteria bacterium]
MIELPADLAVLIGAGVYLAFFLRPKTDRLALAATTLGGCLCLGEVPYIHLTAQPGYTLTGLVVISLLAAIILKRKDFSLRPLIPWLVLVLIWLAWVGLGLALAGWPPTSLGSFSRLAQLLFFAALMGLVSQRPEALAALFRGLTYTLAAVAGVAIYQFFAGRFYLEIGRTTMSGYDYLIQEPMGFFRAGGTFTDPNNLAVVLALATLGLAWLIARGGGQVRLSAGLALYYCGLLVTLSRSIWFGLIVGGLIVFRRAGWVFMAVVLGASLLGLGWSSYARQDPPRPGKTPYTSASSRWVYWEAAWDMAQDSPLFGVGLNQYHRRFLAMRGQEVLDDLRMKKAKPHGLFIGLGAETGLVGLGLFALMMLWPFWRLVRQRGSLARLAAGLLAATAVNAFFH